MQHMHRNSVLVTPRNVAGSSPVIECHRLAITTWLGQIGCKAPAPTSTSRVKHLRYGTPTHQFAASSHSLKEARAQADCVHASVQTTLHTTPSSKHSCRCAGTSCSQLELQGPEHSGSRYRVAAAAAPLVSVLPSCPGLQVPDGCQAHLH